MLLEWNTQLQLEINLAGGFRRLSKSSETDKGFGNINQNRLAIDIIINMTVLCQSLLCFTNVCRHFPKPW